ncbi:hypothetical protein ACFV4P_34690, partial [Kitasatospora sp. NPDC059795]|uniref:hypothetical protein n=1 Tax=Kitasatospora sp. NPDC059795 TaxID=3346949 RepID=UPI003650E557
QPQAPLNKFSAVGGPFAGMNLWQFLLTFLPLGLALAFVLGAVGAAIGAGAAIANIKVAKKDLTAPLKALAMIGVDLGAAALWLVIVIVLNIAVGS